MSACDQILFKKQLTVFPAECVYDLIEKHIDEWWIWNFDVHCIHNYFAFKQWKLWENKTRGKDGKKR